MDIKSHIWSSSTSPLLLLVAGDFNSVLNTREDKSVGNLHATTSSPNSPTHLMQFADGLQVTDLWRLTHLEGREYTSPTPQLAVENRLYPSELPPP